MRKIPLRKCLATNEQLPKKELIRVVTRCLFKKKLRSNRNC